MKRFLLSLVVAPTLLLASAPSTPSAGQRVLENNQLSLTVQSRGAMITDLHLKNGGGNWLSSPGDREQELFAHFLCFDRWGRVTAEERRRGIPFHGEAVRQVWDEVKSSAREATLAVTLPVVKLRAVRTIRLAKEGSAFRITTTFQNPTSETRPYNAVEHVTLSENGFAENTRVSTNASRGVVQFNGDLLPNSTFRWPDLTLNGKTWDLRDWVRVQGMLTTSLVFDDDEQWGWVCVENPSTGELIGYVWPTEDFPWLMLWTRYSHGRVISRAIEPATTGANGPLGRLAHLPPLLDRPLQCHLEPGEERTRRLWGFVLNRTPGGAGEVTRVSVEEDGLRIEFVSGQHPLHLPVE